MEKDITKFDKKIKYSIFDKLLDGKARLMQEPKTRIVTIKRGRHKIVTDVYSLEDFLRGRNEEFVYKKQKRKNDQRELEIIKLF
jgi:hypothetical protein